MNSIDKFTKIITDIVGEKKKTYSYDTEGVVKRIDPNTGEAWVQFGEVDETPVQMTVNAKPGDTVKVRVADGVAWIYGNNSSPPSDNSVALDAINETNSLKKAIYSDSSLADTIINNSTSGGGSGSGTSGTNDYEELINKPSINGRVLIGNVNVSGDKSFVYEQQIPSDRWEVTHNLGKHPSVTVIDSAGTEVIGEYTMVDANTAVLEFSGAFAGKAYFN